MFHFVRCKTYWKKARNGFGVADKPKSGRPITLSQRDRNRLVIISKQNPKFNASEVRKEASLETTTSISTVKRVLRTRGLFGRVSVRKPFISKINKSKRLRWCMARREWNQEWKRIIFSDECKLELHPTTRTFVRRGVGKALQSRYLTPTRKFSPSIMVWRPLEAMVDEF